MKKDDIIHSRVQEFGNFIFCLHFNDLKIIYSQFVGEEHSVCVCIYMHIYVYNS